MKAQRPSSSNVPTDDLLNPSEPVRPWESIYLALLCSLLGAAAQLLLKSGMKQEVGRSLWDALLTLPIFSGYALYGVSTLLFLGALRRGELSVIYPMLGITYFWVVVASAILLPGEPLNSWKLAGSFLIVLGVSLVGRSRAR